MYVLALIPARGGSKVKMKNIKEFKQTINILVN